MSSIRAQAALDLQTEINLIGEDVTLTKPGTPDTVYEIKGLVFRVDLHLEPGTNLEMNEPRTSVTISLLDINKELPTEDWEVSTADVLEGTIAGQVMNPVYDRTLATCRFIIEDVT